MPGNMQQRAPRTPESYFNVPESITLLNIVKSDRIQSAFQSNRKNHASVWEMVANILTRYSDKKRSAKQCCNRYENLKKIYTQLKRNPEKHLRRNWPYMYLFREIEEQRGECWGSNSKRNKESYYYRRRALMLMKEEQANDTNSSRLGTNLTNDINSNCNVNINNNNNISTNNSNSNNNNNNNNSNNNNTNNINNNNNNSNNHSDNDVCDSLDRHPANNNNYNGFVNIKEEYPEPEYENDDDNSFINSNYNGNQDMYINGQHDNETNILHPDVIVDTDHVTDSSSISLGIKRKLSTSTDTESTNYELIEYLKRREKRDEEMFKRMEDREEKLIKLLERTVVAIELIASQNSSK